MFFLLSCVALIACDKSNSSDSELPAEEVVEMSEEINEATNMTEEEIQNPTEDSSEGSENQDEFQDDDRAKITAVTFTGDSGNYNFNATIESPDTGCDQYADWWEVITTEGALVYRRVLGHSHVTEQPFTRSGGPVNIAAEDEVIIRAHMNTSGYGTQVMRGSVASGFESETIASDFATNLAIQDPLPSDCAF